MKIGVLALQGDFFEHCTTLRALRIPTLEVRTKKDLSQVDGLIIPGGESTTIGKLMKMYGLDQEIVRRAKKGMPIYGTCAGAILLSKKILESKQKSLKLIDVTIKRNDYGRQKESFEANIPFRKGYLQGFFIRAPILYTLGAHVEPLAFFENKVVLAKQKNILISTFHPELTGDVSIHRIFAGMVHHGCQ